MTNVFISYANADRPKAEQLVSQLRRVSVAGWRDVTDLAAGEVVSASTREALRRSSAVIVLLSPRSLGSEWLQFEMGAAEALGKKIIPVIIEGENIEQALPVLLRELPWLDGRNKTPHEVARDIEEAVGR
jgi:hypothetical protein